MGASCGLLPHRSFEDAIREVEAASCGHVSQTENSPGNPIPRKFFHRMSKPIKLSVQIAVFAFVLFTLVIFGVGSLRGEAPNLETYNFGVSLLFVIWGFFFLACNVRIQLETLGEFVFFLVFGTAFAALVFQVGWGLFVEIVLLMVILVAFASSEALPKFFRSMPRVHRFVFAALFVLMTFGQLLRNSYDTFPFVAWQMYGKLYGDSNVVGFYLIEGITQDDERIEINAERLYPSLGYGSIRMANKLLELEREAFRNHNPDALEDYKQLVMAIARGHNRRRPEEIIWIEVMHVKVQIDPPRTEKTSVWKAKVE